MDTALTLHIGNHHGKAIELRNIFELCVIIMLPMAIECINRDCLCGHKSGGGRRGGKEGEGCS